ncbi:MAG: sulfite exporter TauE/SafE family protein [Neisseriaceae bacterium]|nr:sulfite exporter TauE/SafE family protein [Neisseriaceae bacterium]
MIDFSWLMIFLLGFLGGVHCVGMCGSLNAALVLQLPNSISRIRFIILLNIGRISSYVLVGALLGGLSQLGFLADPTGKLRLFFRMISLLILLGTGLYLMGISSWLMHIEKIGQPLWKKINPLLKHFLPIQSMSSALIVGALWGWLPCGLVYSASIYALSTGHVVYGALVMLLFGLGTLPNLMALGLLSGTLKPFLQNKIVRIFSGCLIIAWVAWSMKELVMP